MLVTIIMITDYEKLLKEPQNTEWKFITSRSTKLLFFMCDEQKAFRYFPFDFYVAQASFEWPRVDLTRPRLKNSVLK